MTPAELLAATAADMRAVADRATDAPWRYDPEKHHRELGTVRFSEGVFAGPAGKAAICVATTGMTNDRPSMADAEHIAAWDPDMARAVADWLDSKAIRYANPDMARLLDADLRQGIEPPMLKVCAAWWKSRGRKPEAVATT